MTGVPGCPSSLAGGVRALPDAGIPAHVSSREPEGSPLGLSCRPGWRLPALSAISEKVMKLVFDVKESSEK